MPDSWTITIITLKQNVWFQGGICYANFNFKMADLWQSLTLISGYVHGSVVDTAKVKQNVRVQGRMHPEKFLSRGGRWDYSGCLSVSASHF